MEEQSNKLQYILTAYYYVKSGVQPHIREPPKKKMKKTIRMELQATVEQYLKR
jgi:hypothetical protein